MRDRHFLTTIFKEEDFTAEELKTILSGFKKVTFEKNDYLLREGKTAQHYWLAEAGFMRSFVIDIQGKDVSTHFYTAGDIVIDWPSFFLRAPARENIQVLSDCVCWQLDFATFQTLFHSIETFREQGRTRLVASYFALKNRSISMITDQAKERYRRLMEEQPQIIQHVSLKLIATYLGITDTSLSRIRKEIASE